MINRINSPAEYKLVRDHTKVNQKLEQCEHNITYCEMVKSEVSGLSYNKDTHDEIKARSEELQKKFGDSCSSMLQASKKKELIETIVKLCESTIAIEQERMKELNAKLFEIESLKHEFERINARIEHLKANQKE